MLPLELEKRLEQFESSWGTIDSVSIRALIANVAEADRLEFLSELVMTELELRCDKLSGRARLNDQLGEYFREFPELSDDRQLRDKIVAHAESLQGPAADPIHAPGRDTRVDHDTSAPGERVAVGGLRPPCQFGKFMLTRVIGDGGMGTVFEARQEKPRRRVAIKVLHPSVMSDEDAAARFNREIDLVSSIEDPGVVPVFEAGTEGSHRYFVMPLLRGGTLRTRIQDGQLKPRDSASILRDLTKAVAAAHRHGIVHRDLKPGNILFDTEGRAQIADFGLSRHVDQAHSLTRTGQICGTPGYIAPERIKFGREEIDEIPGDIYSLGAVLYDMLCGRPPFRGATPWETFSQSLSAPPVPPTKLNPNVDRDLETICLKCLEHDPRERYEDCQALAADLDRYLANQPIAARRPSVGERGLRYVRRHPARSGLISACVALILFSVVLLFQSMRLNDSERRFQSQQALRLSETYVARMAEADLLHSHRDPGWRAKSLLLLEEAAALDLAVRDDERLRSLAASMVAQRDIHPIATLAEGMWCDALDFDPTGKFLALGQNRDEQDFKVYIYAVDDLDAEPFLLKVDCSQANERRRQAEMPRAEDGARALRFSPDGKRLAIGTRHGLVHLYQWDGRQAIHLSTHEPDPGVEVYRLRFSPDGSALWVLSDEDRLRLIRNQQVETFAPLADAKVDCMDVSPTDDALFVLLENRRVCRYPFDAGEASWVREYSYAAQIAASTDGRYLAVTRSGSTLLETLDTWLGHTRSVTHAQNLDGSGLAGDPVFGHDDAFVLSSSRERTVALWDFAQRKSIAEYVVTQRGGKPKIAVSTTEPLIAITEHLKVTVFRVDGCDVVETVSPSITPLRDLFIDEATDRILAVGSRSNDPGSKAMTYNVYDPRRAEMELSYFQHFYTAMSFPTEPTVSGTYDQNFLLTIDNAELPLRVPIGHSASPRATAELGPATAWIPADKIKVSPLAASASIDEPTAIDGKAIRLTPADSRDLILDVPGLQSFLQERPLTSESVHVYVLCRLEGESLPRSVRLKVWSRFMTGHEARLTPDAEGSVAIWAGALLLKGLQNLKIEIDLGGPVDSLVLDGIYIVRDEFRDHADDPARHRDPLWRLRRHRETGQFWAVMQDEELRVLEADGFQPVSSWWNLSDSHTHHRGTLEPLLDTADWTVSGTTGGELFVFDARTYQLETKVMYLEANVRALDQIDNLNEIAVGYNDGTVQILRLPDLARLQTLSHHRLSIEAICYDSRRHWLWTGSEDGKISVWRRVGGSFELYFELDLQLGRVHRLAFLQDPDSLAVIFLGDTAVRLIHMDGLLAPLSRMDLVD